MDDMQRFYTVQESGANTIVEFQTQSLMSPLELEQIGAGLFKLVEGGKPQRLVLDFSKVKYLSSQAIGIILTLNKMLTGTSAGGESLALCGIGPQLLQLLKVTRLDRILNIKPTRKDAIAS